MSTSLDPSSSAQAEAEAETARSGLVDTLSQLRENLKPANMVDEMMTSAKVNANAITNQMMETARKNPLPALMIGAGVAMILGLGSRYGTSSSPRAMSGTSARRPESRPMSTRTSVELDDETLAGRAVSVIGSATDRAGDLLGGANDRLAGVARRSASAVNNAYSNATRGDSMSTARQTLNSSLNRLIDEQPLVLGVLGVLIGAAVGAALPHTDAEDSLMGETSGSVRAAAQGAVQDQLTQVKAAASHAVDDIKQTVADHGVTTDNLNSMVRDIGDKAKAASYEAGKGLTPET